MTGLGAGTIVRYNGIDVGTVRDVRFDPVNPRTVVVDMQLDPTLPLHVDSVASLEAQGLTGAVYVEIAGGTAESPLLRSEPGQEYAIIPSKQSALQQLAQAGPELINRFNVVGERASDLLNDENRKALSETLENLRVTTGLLARHSADLDATVANLRTATAGIGTTLGNVDKTLASADRAFGSVDTAVGQLNTAITSADTTVQKIGRLSDDADKVVTGQGVAQMTQLVAQTRALVTSLTRLTNDLQREPTRLIFGDQRQGYTPP